MPDTPMREQKQRFFVHFVVFGNFDLDAFLTNLHKLHGIRFVKNKRSGLQSIEIEIEPSLLREMQESIPEDVIVSYEKI